MNSENTEHAVQNCWKAIIDICLKQMGIKKPKYAIGELIQYRQNLRFVKTHWSNPAMIVGYYFGENHKPGEMTYIIDKYYKNGKHLTVDYVSSRLDRFKKYNG